MITCRQAERLESFRKERFRAIRSAHFTRADDQVIPLQAGPKAVLHLVPVCALVPIPRAFVMAAIVAKHINLMTPMTTVSEALQRQNTFEGVRTYAISSKTDAAYKYSLWFRTGAVEDVHVFSEGSLPLGKYEQELREQLHSRTAVLREVTEESTVIITLSLLDASGKLVSGDSEWGTYPIEGDELVTPPYIDTGHARDASVDGLRAAVESLQNAGGAA